MTGTHPLRILVGLLAAVLLTTACTPATGTDPQTTQTPEPQPFVREAPFGSEFSRDGTLQSHIRINGIDFVYTVWSAKATPRMQEWYPKGDKFFSFSFQAYDTRRRLRDPFATKRLVWLERTQITSSTTTKSGTVESPYALDARAEDITFDPEPRTLRRRGMLITSPKGAFELRNQAIKDMADDTEGVTLTFRFTVHVQAKPGSRRYFRRDVVQELPIAIFSSEYATRPQPVPYNAT